MERKENEQKDAAALPELQKKADKAEEIVKDLLTRVSDLERDASKPLVEKKSGGKLIFGYWAIRGLAQPIRLLLNYVGVAFEDKRYTQHENGSREEWNSVKNKIGLDLPNLPYLIDGDLKLTQSNAILHYVASQYQPTLCGRTPAEAATMEMVLGFLADARGAGTGICYNPRFAELLPGYISGTLHENLQYLSSYIGQKKWLFGDNLSYVDPVAYEYIDVHRLMCSKEVEKYKNLIAFANRFEALPAIAAYMKHPDFIRRPINNTSATFK